MDRFKSEEEEHGYIEQIEDPAPVPIARLGLTVSMTSSPFPPDAGYTAAEVADLVAATELQLPEGWALQGEPVAQKVEEREEGDTEDGGPQPRVAVYEVRLHLAGPTSCIRFSQDGITKIHPGGSASRVKLEPTEDLREAIGGIISALSGGDFPRARLAQLDEPVTDGFPNYV